MLIYKKRIREYLTSENRSQNFFAILGRENYFSHIENIYARVDFDRNLADIGILNIGEKNVSGLMGF